MRRVAVCLSLVLILGMAVLIVWAGIRVRANSVASLGSYRSNWSPEAAASYLDNREAWWQSWPEAQRSQGTVCLSCHTVVPYALVRPGLRAEFGQAGMTVAETKMLGSIEKRVNDWAQMEPFYTDAAHAAPSRATEAVLNAVILARYSVLNRQFTSIAVRAFDEAWALQKASGANAGGWEWQDFHEAPWESPESAYQGAAMLEMAVQWMPASYGNDPGVGEHVASLRQYLLQHYGDQPPMNQLYVLWASAQTPDGLLSNSQRTELIREMAALQREDGGWSLTSIDAQKAFKRAAFNLFKRANDADGSDGVATGLVVVAAEASGMRTDDPMLKRGIAWLEAHQYQGGNWWASSLNGFRNPSSGMGLFMSDAATGYAVLALEQSQGPPSASAGDDKNGRATAPDAIQAARASW